MPFDTESRISESDLKMFNVLARREVPEADSSLKELEALIGASVPSGSSSAAPSSPSHSLDISRSPSRARSPGPPPPPQKSPTPPSSPPRSDPPSDAGSTGRWQDTFGDAQFNEEDFADVDVDAENRDPRIRREKQEILFQLLKLYKDESKGQWNMQMPLFELKYELKRREEYKQEQEQIVFIKDVLKMGFVGIEWANRKLGPVLELDGWAEHITSDMQKFDRCILALYRRYFRRSKMDPMVEFFWLLLGSMVMFHVQSKYLGGPPRPPAGQAGPPDLAPPPGSDDRFSFGQSKPKTGFNLNSLFNLFARGQ